MKKEKNKIELSEKEAYLLWNISCNIGTGISHALKAKLYSMVSNESRWRFRKTKGDYVVEKFQIYYDPLTKR